MPEFTCWGPELKRILLAQADLYARLEAKNPHKETSVSTVMIRYNVKKLE